MYDYQKYKSKQRFVIKIKNILGVIGAIFLLYAIATIIYGLCW